MSDVIVALSAAFVAAMAFIGLSRWRKELGGKAKFGLARDIMLLSLKLEADFQWARHKLSMSWESTDRKRKADESLEEAQLLDQWHVRWRRLQPLSERLQKLQELGWEAEVLLDTESGEQVSEAIKVFRACWAELSTAIEDYFATKHEEIIKGSKFRDQAWLDGLRKEIYATSDDEMSKRISGAKERLVSVLRAHVK